MRWITLFFLTFSIPAFSNPRVIAEKYLGKDKVDTYLNSSMEKVQEQLAKIPDNKKKTFGKSILLNLYGSSFDTTLIHDGKKIISFTRVFYDEESAPSFFSDIEKIGKNNLNILKVKSELKPGTYFDFDFKNQGVYFRFTQSKKIQVITLKKN